MPFTMPGTKARNLAGRRDSISAFNARRPWAVQAVVFLLLLGQVTGLILLTERPARAYVDPGSGILILQVLGASMAGMFYSLRHRLARWLGRSQAPEPCVDPNQPQPAAQANPASDRASG